MMPGREQLSKTAELYFKQPGEELCEAKEIVGQLAYSPTPGLIPGIPFSPPSTSKNNS